MERVENRRPLALPIDHPMLPAGDVIVERQKRGASGREGEGIFLDRCRVQRRGIVSLGCDIQETGPSSMCRQGEEKRCALVRRGLSPDSPLVSADDPVDDRQADSGARELRGVQPLEWLE